MRSVTILAKNVLPSSDEIKHETNIDLWIEVERYFSGKNVETSRNGKIRLSIDASEIKEVLKKTAALHIDAFFENLRAEAQQQGRLPDSPFAGSFKIHVVEGKFDSNAEFDDFIIRFVETLFLAMNLSVHDGCNLSYVKAWQNAERKIDVRDLSNYSIEGAWHRSHQGKWPALQTLSFCKSWEWLVEHGALSYVLADTSAAKAIAVLTELSYTDTLRLTDVVQVSHVLESFLLSKDEPRSRGIKRKAQVVLGSAADANVWATSFYKIRSGIVHGDYPIFYPRYSSSDHDFEKLSSHYWQINEVLLQGVAVVIGLVQDLIISGSSKYQFEEKLSVVRH